MRVFCPELACVAFIALSGCVTSYSALGDGRIAAAGNFQAAARVAAAGRAGPGGEGVFRYGVNSWLDVGARAGTFGAHAEARFQPFRNDEAMTALLVSVSAGGFDRMSCGGDVCGRRVVAVIRIGFLASVSVGDDRVRFIMGPFVLAGPRPDQVSSSFWGPSGGVEAGISVRLFNRLWLLMQGAGVVWLPAPSLNRIVPEASLGFQFEW